MAISSLLQRNEDGSPNFSIRRLTSDSNQVTTTRINEALTELFASAADTVVFYFAGHGCINEATQTGYIVSQNGCRGALGISLSEILALANQAYPKIRSTVIIIDACHSGFTGEIPGLGNPQVSIIGTGVTILTACHRSETAAEEDGNGLFTYLLLDGLHGSSTDVCGRITPAALYSHIDQTLGAWKQRPVYKANVQSFVELRHVAPKIPLDVLRRLPTYFPETDSIFPLDPSFEPDRASLPKEYRNMPINEDNVRMFADLQKCNRYGLVIPVDAEHMFFAALHSKGCKLSRLGVHYRRLAIMERI